MLRVINFDDALPVWVGVDIGGSHIGLSFFTSSQEHCSNVNANLQVMSLPPGIEKTLNNTTLWYEGDGQKIIDCVSIGINMIHMKLKNLSTTAEQLLQYVYILISRVINAQESFVRDSLNIFYWNLKGVGIGCPGQCKGGVLVAASNFPLLKNVPVVTELENLFYEKLRLQVTVCLLNDADAAIAAEVWGDSDGKYGQYSNIAMVTLGTGIGMGLVLMGQLYQGSNGLVEGGHMIISDKPTARQCPCGQVGCVEAYSSATSTAKRLRDLDNLTLDSNRNGSTKSPQRAISRTTATATTKPMQKPVDFGSETTNPTSGIGNDDASSLSAKKVFERYIQHDVNAVVVVDETAEQLAVMVVNICRIIDPDVIIFGGGMSKSGALLLTLVEKHLRKKTWTVLPTQVKLLTASTRHANDVDVGILGAALVARRAYHGDIGIANDSKVTTKDIRSVDSRNEGNDSFDSKNPPSVPSVPSLLLRSVPWIGAGLLISSMAKMIPCSYLRTRFCMSSGTSTILKLLNLKSVVGTTHSRLIHLSPPQLFSRKSGSNALESPVRPLSKKQKKRRSEKREREEKKKTDPRVLREQRTYLKKRMEEPETQDFIDKLKSSLFLSVREAALPNHALSGMELSLDGTILKKEEPPQPKVDFEKVYSEFIAVSTDDLLRSTTTAKDLVSAASAKLLEQGIDNRVLNETMVHFCRNNDASSQIKGITIFSTMSSLSLEIFEESYKTLIELNTKRNKFVEADKIFDAFIDSSKTPSPILWEAKIRNIARSGDPDGALETIDRIQKAGVPVSCGMFCEVLDVMTTKARFDAAYSVWERMHLEPTVTLDAHAFAIMMRHCSMQAKVERAFFYNDEMRILKIEPTLEYCHALLQASAHAPHWVNGYQDTIFEAMSVLENAEIVPTVETYNCIIYAFSEACDSVGAEYYFWEMQRKGMQPDLTTFRNVFRALARAQTVGASEYRTLGRYARPPEKPLSADHQAMKDIGAIEVSKIMSSGMTADYEPEPGKRVKPKYYDILEDDETEEPGEIIMNMIRERAQELKGGKVDAKEEEDEDEEIDFEALAENDSTLRKMIDSMNASGGSTRQLADGSSRRKTVVQDEPVTGKDAELRKMRAILAATDTDLSDPFAHMESSKFNLESQKRYESDQGIRVNVPPSAEYSDLVSLLDNKEGRGLKTVLGSQDDEKSIARESRSVKSILSDEFIHRKWDEVEFGRAPDTEFHSIPLQRRRKQNITRAELIFNQGFLQKGMKPNVMVLTEFMAVHSEAAHVEDAMAVFQRFSDFNVTPNERTYRYLIMMHIRNNDIQSAIDVKDDMKRKGITPHKQSYGVLIQSLVQRNKIVESLKLLEEAALHHERPLAEKYIKYLRARCVKLNIKHPNIPADPNAWVKKAKATRRNLKHSSQSSIQNIRSHTFL